MYKLGESPGRTSPCRKSRAEGEAALAAVLQRLMVWDSIHEHRQFIACSTIERLRKNFQDWYSVREGEIPAGGLF